MLAVNRSGSAPGGVTVDGGGDTEGPGGIGFREGCRYVITSSGRNRGSGCSHDAKCRLLPGVAATSGSRANPKFAPGVSTQSCAMFEIFHTTPPRFVPTATVASATAMSRAPPSAPPDQEM